MVVTYSAHSDQLFCQYLCYNIFLIEICVLILFLKIASKEYYFSKYFNIEYV